MSGWAEVGLFAGGYVLALAAVIVAVYVIERRNGRK